MGNHVGKLVNGVNMGEHKHTTGEILFGLLHCSEVNYSLEGNFPPACIWVLGATL